MFVETGYGQDLSAFGHSFADPSQQTASYAAAPSAPSSGAQPAAGSFGRGQNHNVQGFHPYRRWAALSPPPQCNTHRQGFRRFHHKLDWILGLSFWTLQIKKGFYCVWQGLYSDNRRQQYSSIFCSRTELLMYLAIDLYCLVKHQHRTEAPDISDRVSQLFSFNSISGKMFFIFNFVTFVYSMSLLSFYLCLEIDDKCVLYT